MKTFKEFMAQHDDLMQPVQTEDNPVLNRIIGMAWANYRDETEKFIQSLADQDVEIKKEYSKLHDRSQNKPMNQGDNVFGNKDKPVPPSADTGSDYPE